MNIPTASRIRLIQRFLRHIVKAPTPDEVTDDYLKSDAFILRYSQEIRQIFRLLGFLGEDDKPTERWNQYKSKGIPVLRAAVKECYKELFLLFPDATIRSDKELETWFSPPITRVSKTSIDRSIRTFRKLCTLAEMGLDEVSTSYEPDEAPEITVGADKGHFTCLVIQPSYYIRDQADYERVFRALKKVFFE